MISSIMLVEYRLEYGKPKFGGSTGEDWFVFALYKLCGGLLGA